MKKFLFLLTTAFCLYQSQSLHAISAGYSESLNEIQALLSSDVVTSYIPVNEFVVGVKRKSTNASTFFPSEPIKVVYFVLTSGGEEASSADETERSKSSHHKGRQRKHLNRYRVTTRLSPNHALGNPIQEILSIEKVECRFCHHHKT